MFWCCGSPTDLSERIHLAPSSVICSFCWVSHPALLSCPSELHTSDVQCHVHNHLLLQGLPLAAVTAALSLPGFLVKQIINCFQLRSSMQVGAVQAWNSGLRLLAKAMVEHCEVTSCLCRHWFNTTRTGRRRRWPARQPRCSDGGARQSFSTQCSALAGACSGCTWACSSGWMEDCGLSRPRICGACSGGSTRRL